MVSVDWLELELAFRDASDTESFIDRMSGQVLTIVPGFDDEEEIRETVAREPSRYVQIQSVTTDHARKVMQDFIATVRPGEALSALQQAATASSGTFTRSLAVLRDYPNLLSRYHRFEQERLWAHIEGFLDEIHVAVSNPAPNVELFEGNDAQF